MAVLLRNRHFRPRRAHAYPLCQTEPAYCHCEERPCPPVIASAAWQSRRRSAVAMMIPRRVLSRNEIATWFDRLTMSGYAPRNDRWGWVCDCPVEPTGSFGCHCEERSDVAISLRLSTCRGTIIATATRLPRCARNDMRKTERPWLSLAGQTHSSWRVRHSGESRSPKTVN